MVQINDNYYEDLDEINFAKLLENLKNNIRVLPGSQKGRKSSSPLKES
tara:strand:- start:893 stop:1036 length:144 start_codon:yes stop_codon:yes gene_type:complete